MNRGNRIYSGYNTEYDLHVAKVDRTLEFLNNYAPKQIEFYYDAHISPQKVDSFTKYRELRFKALNNHWTYRFYPTLATKHLISKNKSVVLTGIDAEAQIIQTINNRSEANPDSRHVVFSTDSDLFTFEPKNAKNIDIVTQLENESKGLFSINLGQVHADSLVPTKCLQEVPQVPQIHGLDPSKPMLSTAIFLNNFRIHETLVNRLDLLYAPHGVNPYDIGVDVRRATYGVILDRWLPGKHSDVEENLQYNGQIIDRKITPMEGDELAEFKNRILKKSIVEIIEWQFGVVAQQYDISDGEITAIRTYITKLLNNKDVEMCDTFPRGEVLFVLLKSLLGSVAAWEEVAKAVVQPTNLLWRINVKQLCYCLQQEAAKTEKQAQVNRVQAPEAPAAEIN